MPRAKYKKHLFTFVVLLAILLACTLTVFAHSGGTDENGGHYDSSAGEYHYHHGWPAHHHDDGECPYAFENNVDHDDASSSDSKKNNTYKAPRWLEFIVLICFLIPMPAAGLYVFINALREYKKNPTQKNRINLYFFSFLCFCCIAGTVVILAVRR